MRDTTSRRTVLKTIGLGGLTLAGVSSTASANGGLETLFELRENLGQLPENVTIDRRGYKYVSIPPLEQIWTISPDDEWAERPFAQFQNSGVPLTGVISLEVDPQGTVYANFASDLDTTGNATTNGIYTVKAGEDPEILAELPPTPGGPPTFPSDVTFYGDSVLVTDSFRGVVYRIWLDGEAMVGANGSPVQPKTGPFGANGIAVGVDGTVYVANLDTGTIVEIPVAEDGSAGPLGVYAADSRLIGADGLAMIPGRTSTSRSTGRTRSHGCHPTGPSRRSSVATASTAPPT